MTNELSGSPAPADTAIPRPLGLCLSGGGLRAALFHMGVLRFLAEVGQLAHIQTISTVSGGSIFGAFVAVRWRKLAEQGFSLNAYMAVIYDPFTSLVTGRNLRNEWLGRIVRSAPRLLLSDRSRGDLLAEVLDDWFYGGMLMTELPPGVELVLNAASLTTGRQFRFMRDSLGEWEYGYPTYGSAPVRLSYAVVASSAAPILVPPVRIDPSPYAWTGNPDDPAARPTGDLWLADGGMYDNLGTEWFLGDNAPTPFLIISESSGCLRLQQKRYTLKDLLGRAQGIQYDQSRSVRQRWLQDQMTLRRQIERWREQGKWDVSMDRAVSDVTKEGVILSIDKVIGDQRWVRPRFEPALPKDIVALVSSVRTDLDRFLPVEAMLLAYHGYTLAYVYLRQYAPWMAVGEPRWPVPVSDDQCAAYARSLANGSRSVVFDRARW